MSQFVIPKYKRWDAWPPRDNGDGFDIYCGYDLYDQPVPQRQNHPVHRTLRDTVWTDGRTRWLDIDTQAHPTVRPASAPFTGFAMGREGRPVLFNGTVQVNADRNSMRLVGFSAESEPLLCLDSMYVISMPGTPNHGRQVSVVSYRGEVLELRIDAVNPQGASTHLVAQADYAGPFALTPTSFGGTYPNASIPRDCRRLWYRVRRIHNAAAPLPTMAMGGEGGAGNIPSPPYFHAMNGLPAFNPGNRFRAASLEFHNDTAFISLDKFVHPGVVDMPVGAEFLWGSGFHGDCWEPMTAVREAPGAAWQVSRQSDVYADTDIVGGFTGDPNNFNANANEELFRIEAGLSAPSSGFASITIVPESGSTPATLTITGQNLSTNFTATSGGTPLVMGRIVCQSPAHPLHHVLVGWDRRTQANAASGQLTLILGGAENALLGVLGAGQLTFNGRLEMDRAGVHGFPKAWAIGGTDIVVDANTGVISRSGRPLRLCLQVTPTENWWAHSQLQYWWKERKPFQFVMPGHPNDGLFVVAMGGAVGEIRYDRHMLDGPRVQSVAAGATVRLQQIRMPASRGLKDRIGDLRMFYWQAENSFQGVLWDGLSIHYEVDERHRGASRGRYY